MESQKKVIVLGASGMLGSMVLDVLSNEKNFVVTATLREENLLNEFSKKYEKVIFKKLDVEKSGINEIKEIIAENEWVINAIGVIKPYIHDNNSTEVERAIKINSLFPHLLSEVIVETNKKVIQIATDCVYSGQKGGYVETDLHDALDAYGKTKSLGEVIYPNFYNLRCSIIGPELKGHLSLMDWFLGQPKDSSVNGYLNHKWNGITTFHFVKLCIGIINSEIKINHLQHIIPNGEISKADLLKVFANAYNRKDIIVNQINAEKVVDRTLLTNNERLNKKIWRSAGYMKIPSIEEMIFEMSNFDFSKYNETKI